jgi:hypothetical protein
MQLAGFFGACLPPLPPPLALPSAFMSRLNDTASCAITRGSVAASIAAMSFRRAAEMNSLTVAF